MSSSSRGEQRIQINIALRGDLKELLLAHHESLEAEGLCGSLSDTAKSLILDALAANRNGIRVSSAARRAHMRVSAFALNRFRTTAQEVKAEIENQIALLENSPCPCCGRPMSTHDENHR